jgi:hypothetical protein
MKDLTLRVERANVLLHVITDFFSRCSWMLYQLGGGFRCSLWQAKIGGVQANELGIDQRVIGQQVK